MNLQLALFKLFITFYNVVRLTLVFLPLIYAILLIRTPSVVSIPILKVLFLSFAPALGVAVWNALRFDQFHLMPPESYQKSTQEASVKINVKPELIKEVAQNVCNKRKWKLISEGEHSLELRTSPARDKVMLRWDDTTLSITSKPAYPWIFIDFGRNYKNIIELLVQIKKAHQ